MIHDPLDEIWSSSANSPSTTESDRLRRSLLDRLRRERLRLTLLLGVAAAVLTALSVGLLLALSGPRPFGAATSLLLLPPWIAFALFVRRRFRPAVPVASTSASIRDALAGTLDETRAAQRRLRVVAALHLLSAPVLAFAVRELVASGRVAGGEVRSLAVVLALLLGTTAFALWFRARHRLAPRRRRLEELLAAYD